MLEVVNLSKIYSSKKGAEVRALDGVSLRFPEKGMVFLLGKSGSGKSTLLNVCGGLDAPTDGEIIVKGRSSKDFTQSDFDSYRNTFIGFIFQEYNILNEFSVEENIALALELQGKPKDKAAVDALLKEVDLEGFAKRKPNTLSGGQKQRIAIARALVKSPEIIMADEPTGALDSNTGKQVFETLKKLSENKLVIVVSHDRDFAEQYGDRVIELCDGKILSDVTKSYIESKNLTDNVNTVGDVLCIKEGTELTDGDFEKIKLFLKSKKGDVIIANNDKDIKSFKKVSRISDDGAKEVFVETDEGGIQKNQYTKEDSRFIRSKLPLRHAVKIGLSSIRSKPIRLSFTVILCTVAFVLFGLLSTLSFYDSDSTFRQTMLDSGDTMKIRKTYEVECVWYTPNNEPASYISAYETRFSEDEFAELKAQYGASTFGSVPVNLSLNLRTNSSNYYMGNIAQVGYLDESNPMRDGINGTYPANDSEIVLTEYLADVIVNCKSYTPSGETIEVASRDEIIGKNISINGANYKIVGIINVGTIPEKFGTLADSQEPDAQLKSEFSTYLGDGMHQIAFVGHSRLAALAKENQPFTPDNYVEHRMIGVFANGKAAKYPEWSNIKYMPYGEMTEGVKYTSVNGKTEPADNEAILSERLFITLMCETLNELQNNSSEYDERLANIIQLGYAIMEKGEHKDVGGKSVLQPYTAAQLDAKRTEFINGIKQYKVSLKLSAKMFNGNQNSAFGDERQIEVIGMADIAEEGAYEAMYLSAATNEAIWSEQRQTLDYYEEYNTKYIEDKNAVYGNIFLPFDKSNEQTEKFLQMYKNQEFDEESSRYELRGEFVDKLSMIDGLVDGLSTAFLWIGLVLAVFAALLFSNFISVSISQKKREIGILRAVGARSADVFKIFFSESLFIALVCVVLSTIGSVIICGLLNTSLAQGIGASLFVFGPLSFLVLVAIALVTVVAATFVPVNNAARKKPVDSIRAL
ncbi:MAG: ABC transporter ATP-binding protein/permease [Clostridia bacterium]|nr:ABC transporter ATP-binding protein/permease [Clostridia bacterium]MEE0808777.1 ATP-binding cassette domain-containing protein [Acutalibacteraceae bacterium]